MGRPRFPDATKLLITADAGGSNGYRVKLWKVELAKLAKEIRLEITVCHYPPGTSKWNKIEHRMFSFISMNWRGRPLVSYRTIVELISNTTTTKGLSIRAEEDLNYYETGTKVSDTELAAVPLTPHKFTAIGTTRSLNQTLGEPLALERSRWSGLQLVQLGCPGETTGSFLAGGDLCRPAGQSQLAQAVSFLQSHANVVLVTIDLGFNNMRPCLAYHQVNEACVLQNLATVRLTQILSTLHAADPSLRIVGVGHYDPYLYAHMHSIAQQSFASASIAAIDRLNETLRLVYSAAGVQMANVAAHLHSQKHFPQQRQVEPRLLRTLYAYVLLRGRALSAFG